jgi:hypothetical protein
MHAIGRMAMQIGDSTPNRRMWSFKGWGDRGG